MGDNLAKKIKISPPAARGLLKLAIKDEFGPFKLLDDLEMIDYEKMIDNSLHSRLNKLLVSNIQDIINFMKVILVKNQSLISISKV